MISDIKHQIHFFKESEVIILKDFDMPIGNVGSEPDYAELVRDSARKEFETFKENVMSKSAEDIFYHNY